MKIIEHETPAGPHEFGDSMITIALTDEEYAAFEFILKNAEDMDVPKPLLEKVMKQGGPWDE